MGQAMTSTGANEGAARRRGRSAVLKWIVGGTLMLSVCLILPVACLIMPEYLRAVPPTRTPATRPVLLAENPTTSKTLPIRSVSVQSTTILAATTSTTHRLKFKPFIDANSEWGKKLGEKGDPLNARFDAVLERIAKYEAAKESMDVEAARREIEGIEQEYNNVGGDMNKILGIRGIPLDGSAVTKQFEEYLYWSLTAWAGLEAKAGRYDAAAMWTESVRSFKMSCWIGRNQAGNQNKIPWSQALIRAFDRTEEAKSLWAQEMGYWRQAGGITGFKGIAQAVWRRQVEEYGESIYKIVKSVQRQNSSGSR